MLCSWFLHPGWLDSSLSFWSLQVLSNNCLIQKTQWLMVFPGSCPESSVSLILSNSSGSPALSLVSPVLSYSVFLISGQPIDYSNLAQLQKQCSETQNLISRPVLLVQLVPFSRVLVLCDLSTGVPGSLVPGSLHKPLFLQLHGLSHTGV